MPDLQNFLPLVLAKINFNKANIWQSINSVILWLQSPWSKVKLTVQQKSWRKVDTSIRHHCTENFWLQTRFNFYDNRITWISLHTLTANWTQRKAGVVNGTSINCPFINSKSEMHEKNGTWVNKWLTSTFNHWVNGRLANEILKLI